MITSLFQILLYHGISLISFLCRINPNYTDALIKLSSLLVSLGRNDEAILFVSRSVKLKDNGPDALHNSAAVLMMAGMFCLTTDITVLVF